jgi:hypothetical protein
MAAGNHQAHRSYWLEQARRVRRQVNLAWWLETLAAPLMVCALVGAAALLLLRRDFPNMPLWQTAGALLVGMVLLALGCLAWARRRFENEADSLVRIEAAMRLRNALSAASAGVAPWPPPVARVDAGLSWRWPRLLVPLLGSVLLLTVGAWLPVGHRQVEATAPPEEPQAWQQLAAELDHLTKEELADEKYLEETRRKLDELKAREEEQWFSHSSLEATDSLKKAHRGEVERVERELGRAEKALGALERGAGKNGQAERERLMEQFDQALQGLQNGAMQPNPQLLEQMRGMDLKNLGNIPPEQLEQLRENLRQNAQGLRGAGDGAADWDEELLADEDGDGDGQGQGDGDGEGAGSGGVDRGPGHAPGVLGKERDRLATGEKTGLEARDLSHASPGDLLELQDGEHQVDRSASSITAGGNTEATGLGGDRVWRESLDPDEQRVLKRFFE